MGHFVELGNQHLHRTQTIQLIPLTENITYAVVDINRMISKNDCRISQTLQKCSELLFNNSFVPLNNVIFSLVQAEQAFLCMNEDQHTEKVVIYPLSATYSPPTIPVYRNILPISSQGIYVRDNSTSFVTARTLWFSLELVVGLLKRGAKRLTVCSRSGEGNTARQQQFE